MRRKVVESLISRLILLISAGVVFGGCDDTMTAEPTPMSEGDSNRKIIGGSGTNIESVPWQVAISFVADPTDHIWCGGSIISPDWILTAAHCLDTVENAADLKVRAGITNLDETGGQIRHASEYIVHSDYDSELLFNDIALIKLDAPLDLTGSKAKAIQLATNTDLAAFAPNEEGLVSGWGYARYGDQQYLPNTLQSVKIPIQPNPMSFLIYETLEYPILDSMFSAGI
jgi:secreted trypsin-like serine protease